MSRKSPNPLWPNCPLILTVTFTANAYGEPESVGSYASNIGFHPNGSIATLNYGTQHGSGHQYTTTQNARQLPEVLKIVEGATTIAQFTHTYDANANITAIDDAINGTGFDRSMGYDDLDRLTSSTGFWGTGSYSFDALGNLLTKTETGSLPEDLDLDYSYNATSNRLTSIDDTAGSADYTFAYDAYGNVTDNGTHAFDYNLAGNLTEVVDLGIDNYYDGHKRRVREDDGSQVTYTVYSQSGQLMHKLEGGVETDYVYAGSLLVAEKSGSAVDYMYTDLLGSPIAGNNASSYKEHYRPWGEKKDNPIQLADDVGYTGHQSDIETGLTYMQARYYDPVVGRFMAVDPVQFDGGNPEHFGRYSYAINNPTNMVDPTGMDNEPADWLIDRQKQEAESIEGKTATFKFSLGPLSRTQAQEINIQTSHANNAIVTITGAVVTLATRGRDKGLSAAVGAAVGAHLAENSLSVEEHDTVHVETTVEFTSDTDSGHRVIDQRISVTNEKGEKVYPAEKNRVEESH